MKIANIEVKKAEDLLEVPSKDLLQFYNRKTGRSAKKFSSRSDGMNRVWKLVEPELKQGKKKTRNVRQKSFKLPCRPELSGRKIRQGTKRAKTLELLNSEKGATFEEVKKVNKWKDKDAYEGIRLLNYYHGYGLKMEDNKIIAYMEE